MAYGKFAAMKETISDRLKQARVAAGFETVEQAAAALGVPYQTYAGHENGRSGFKADSIVQYCRRYKVSTDWLLTGRGKGPGGSSDIAYEIYLLAQTLPVSELTKALDIIRVLAQRSDPREQNLPLN
jgi:transcriptional regulator with XRE-family HTH domain